MKGFSPFHQEKKTVTAGRIVEAKQQRRLPTYKEAWGNMSDEEKDKHGSYEGFVKAAKEYKANWIKQCKKGLNPNDTNYNKDVVSGVRKVLTKSTKTTKQCKKEWNNVG